MRTGKQELEFLKWMGDALLYPDYAQKIAGLFGLDCSELVDTYEISTEPKANHGRTGYGVPAFKLSVWLCQQLGLKYQAFHERETQHRECCDRLIKSLS
ncbi:MAG: hypothetical protein ACYTBZ_29515 [Planctomycetota bacterium]|jgi:hypothetical protein